MAAAIRCACGRLAVVLLVAAAQGGVARADCPSNHVKLNYFTQLDTRAAVFDSTAMYGDPPSCGGRVAYDMRRGDVHLDVGAGFNSCGTAALTLSDDFQIEALETSSPVPFRVLFEVHYSGHQGSGYGQGSASIEENGQTVSAEWYYGPPADTVLSLTLSHAAGEVFHVTLGLTGSGAEGGVVLTGRYRFEDLPPGTRVVSCQGYRGAGDLAVNAMRMRIGRAGSIAYDPTFAIRGFEYPRGSGRSMLFAAGLWVSGLVNGELRHAVSDFGGDEFAPDGPPADRVVELLRHYATTTSRDAALGEYEALAVPAGAPQVVVRANGDLGIPGDQMLWHVYHDGIPTRHTGSAGSTAPMGLRVRQTAFAFGGSAAVGHALFLLFDLANVSGTTIEDARASFWCDPDVGDAVDDLTGCDSTRGLAFAYNGRPTDTVYGTNIPALGIDLLRVAPGSGQGSGRAAGFYRYTGEISSAAVARNIMEGLQGDGSAIVNPTTGSPTTWTCSGDPLSGAGWLDSGFGDRRMLLTSSPFAILPGGTEQIVFAILIGDSLDRMGSIAQLMGIDDAVQVAFDQGFDDTTPVAVSQVAQTVTWDRVQLVWEAPGVPLAFVDRSQESQDWARLDTLWANGQGRLILDDSTVRAGERYGYRLISPGGEPYGSGWWVDVPSAPGFALHGVHPNPSREGWVVSFSLPRPSTARLELVDLQGRRCAVVDLGRPGIGEHRVSFTPESRLGAGVYLLRLRTEFGVRDAKVVLLPR